MEAIVARRFLSSQWSYCSPMCITRAGEIGDEPFIERLGPDCTDLKLVRCGKKPLIGRDGSRAVSHLRVLESDQW
jgi:hypothetical protein